MFWRLSLPFTYIKCPDIFRNKQALILVRLVKPRKIPFQNMVTSSSRLEILQGPDSDGWRLNFRPFDSCRSTPLAPSNLRSSSGRLACEQQTHFRSSLLSLRKVTTGNVSAVRRLLAWVSGVSGEKGKDGSEKGRELSLLLLPLPHLKSPLPTGYGR